MGRIEHHITLINAADILAVGMNLKPATEIRSVALDMLVDTGAAMVYLPAAMIGFSSV
jgi:hypothetical protein